jgi:surface antigen
MAARKAAAALVLTGALALSLPATADPPPWAPANGWRQHHEQIGDNDPGRGYAAQHYDTVTSGGCDRGLIASTLSPTTNNVVGSLIGGAAGGLLGNQFGHGKGQAVTTLLGAVAGIVVGGAIGRSMDPVDQGCVGQALEHAPTNHTVAWRNPDTGVPYEVTPVRTYQEGGGYCREYTSSAMIDGRRQQTTGTACRQPDGSWRIQN